MAEHADNYQGPGLYKHYKGSEYNVLGLSIDEDEKPEGDDNWDGVDPRVVYVPLSPGSILPSPHGATMWGRKLSDFNAMVPCFRDDDCAMRSCSCSGTGLRPRFTMIAPATDMTFDEFQRLGGPVKFPLEDKPITFWGCELGGEAGELLNIAKKIERDGIVAASKRNAGIENMIEEGGDVLLALSWVLAKRAIPLKESARFALAKLAAMREEIERGTR